MPTISWSGSTSPPRGEVCRSCSRVCQRHQRCPPPQPGVARRRTTPSTAVPEQAHLWGRVPTVFPPRGLCRSISDGAAAVVVMSAKAAERAGVRPLAETGTHGNVAGPDNSLHSQPSNAHPAGPSQGRADDIPTWT